MTNKCPICSDNNLTIVFEQHEVPVFQNKVYETRAKALAAGTGKVKLTQCKNCLFVFNSNFENELMVYDQNYHNEQGFSDYFKNHLGSILQKLIDLKIQGKKVVEIGCGKGYFLEMLLEKNVNVTGFDPTYEGSSPRVVKDYFSKKYSGLNADVILLRHTLEHIPNVKDFIQEVAEANNHNGFIFIEVPTFDWILKKQSFWDIFYEHCNYFTEATLGSIFGECETGAIFGGQYIYLWGNLATVKDKIGSSVDPTVPALSFDKTIQKFKTLLEQHKGKVAIWGAAAKGSTFLNLLDEKREYVRYVIDINPSKQNKFIARTGHAIFPPQKIHQEPVDLVLVMNENYYTEIVKTINNPNIQVQSI